MKENRKLASQHMKKEPKRRRDNHALRNVVSLRMSDDELKLLQRIRAATSKSASDIMRDAFDMLQRTCSPSFQN
jgi:hypothetical protein